jgi:membrane dipeptidase
VEQDLSNSFAKLDRRQLIAGAAAAVPCLMAGRAPARTPIYIGDMHFHLFFFGRKPAWTQPLARNMADGQATLVSWSLVGDVPWLRPAAGGFKQSRLPRPGEAITWFKQEMARVQAHIAEQNLKIARTAGDIDRAVAGDPHVVLSVEGASFLDEDIGYLQLAYYLGLRHVQLVHCVGNAIGDMQTVPPRYNGLTEFGRRVILECNRLGILVDLAHCTDALIRQALVVSKAPMVWSHSSVRTKAAARYLVPVWQARQLSVEVAKEIAGRGGVIGLWALGGDVTGGVDGYARRIMELSDLLGEDHVAFGTDMNALANPAINGYGDLRRVVDLLEQHKLPEVRIRRIAIGNYARVLKAAMRTNAA